LPRPRSFPRRGIETSQARWVVPSQVKVDLQLVANIVGMNQGQLVTIALLRFLEALRTRWNDEAATVLIPELPSLQAKGRTGTIRDVMDHLRIVER
jgi:hypothetical protein